MKIKVSDYIAKFLDTQKIEYVFEVAGGMITHLLDSLHQQSKIKIISVHHEQSAAFAADAVGRTSNKPGIAFATSGPGATNLITGIGSCYFDSVPALFITGQVNTHEQKGTRKIRQLGFQETDIISMIQAITKKSFQVTDATQIPTIMTEAYECAISDRPGPVLIDIPMNFQRAIIDLPEIRTIQRKKIDSREFINKNSLSALYQAILDSKRPLILAGGGIQCAQARKEFLEFVELIRVPVVTSLLGLDVIPFDHSLRVGLIGTYGNRWANLALGQADLLIVIGSRLDIRQTGADVKSFQDNKTIFHIDCDENEINNRLIDCVGIVADVHDFLKQATSQFSSSSFNFKSFDNWLKLISSLKNKWPDINELQSTPGINPNHFMHRLSDYSEAASVIIADVGNHQMWAAQSIEIKPKQSFITSGGMGAMGYALPAAIGASLASGKKPVVVIVGDGGLQFNIQELQTIVRNQLPIKIVVLNNKTLGMIRQFQDNYFEGRYQSTYWGYSVPDFEKIALAYGIAAKTIDYSEEIGTGIDWLWEDVKEPALLQVMISPLANAFPKIAFGKPITEMEPLAVSEEMEST